MRPEFVPTLNQRRQVEAMSGYGVPQYAIATIIDIDDKTLRLHFRRELDSGSARANAKIGEMLYNKAISGNLTAMIFWAKTRMGWRETARTELEISGPGGGPVQTVGIATNDPIEAARVYQRLMNSAAPAEE